MAPVVLRIPDPVVLVMRGPVAKGTMALAAGNMQVPEVQNTAAQAAKPTMVPEARRIPDREDHVTQDPVELVTQDPVELVTQDPVELVTQDPVELVTQDPVEQERAVLQYVNNQHPTLHEKISRLERSKCLYSIVSVDITYRLWTNRARGEKPT